MFPDLKQTNMPDVMMSYHTDTVVNQLHNLGFTPCQAAGHWKQEIY